MSNENTYASGETSNYQDDSWLQTLGPAWDEQAYADLDLTLPLWGPSGSSVDQASYDLGLQAQRPPMTPITTPTQHFLNKANIDNMMNGGESIVPMPPTPTSAPVTPTAATAGGGTAVGGTAGGGTAGGGTAGCGSSKKRRYDHEDNDAQSKEVLHQGPLRIEDLSGSEYHMLQGIIEEARDEVVKQQQEIKRLAAGLLAMEQRFSESQERFLAKVTGMEEELKAVSGFRRVMGAAYKSLGW